MQVITTLENESKLKKAGRLLGTKTETETVEMALEKVIEDFEGKTPVNDLPEDFFDDLFSEQAGLSDSESIRAILQERGKSDF